MDSQGLLITREALLRSEVLQSRAVGKLALVLQLGKEQFLGLAEELQFAAAAAATAADAAAVLGLLQQQAGADGVFVASIRHGAVR